MGKKRESHVHLWLLFFSRYLKVEMFHMFSACSENLKLLNEEVLHVVCACSIYFRTPKKFCVHSSDLLVYCMKDAVYSLHLFYANGPSFIIMLLLKWSHLHKTD